MLIKTLINIDEHAKIGLESIGISMDPVKASTTILAECCFPHENGHGKLCSSGNYSLSHAQALENDTGHPV
jgi:hypothetical protein